MPQELDQEINPSDNEPQTQPQPQESSSDPNHIKDPAALLNAFNNLKAKNKQQNEELKRSQDKLTQFEAQLQKYSPEKIRELEDKAKTYEERKLEEQRSFNELKQRWTTEKQSYLNQIQTLQNQTQEIQTKYEVEKAFYHAGGRSDPDSKAGMPTYFDLLYPQAIRYVRLEDDRLVVIDPIDGTRVLNDKNQPMSLSELMRKLSMEGPTSLLFYPANNTAGSGARRSDQPGSRANLDHLAKLSPSARVAEARRLGLA